MIKRDTYWIILVALIIAILILQMTKHFIGAFGQFVIFLIIALITGLVCLLINRK